MAKEKPTGADIIEFVARHKEDQWWLTLTRRIDDEITKLYLLKQQPVKATEGKYDVVLDNSSLSYYNRLVSLVAFVQPKFRIPLTGKEPQTEKDAITMTEHAAYGLKNLADEYACALPFGKEPQREMISQACKSGCYVLRFLFSEDKNEFGELTAIPDLAVWNIEDTLISRSKRSIGAVCHIDYPSVEDVKELYDFDAKETRAGIGVERHIYLNDHWEIVEIDGQIVNDGGNYHGLGYVPAVVVSAGAESMPSKSERFPMIAPSIWTGGVDMYLNSSKLMTYRQTLVKLQTNRAYKLYYSGDKGDPPQMQGDPNRPGTGVPLDVDKQQELELLDVATSTHDAQLLEAKIKQLQDKHSVSDIWYGDLKQDWTAQGTAIMMKANMGAITERVKMVEKGWEWFAKQAIHQCKKYKYKDVKIQGVDNTKNQFAATIDTEQLVTDRKIEVEISMDLPQDMMQKAGIALELLKTKAMPWQDIVEQWLDVPDPDGAKERLVVDEVDDLIGTKLRKVQRVYIKKAVRGDQDAEDIVAELDAIIKMRRAALMPPMPQLPGGAPGAGMGSMPGAMPVGAQAEQAASQVNPGNAMRRDMRTLQGRA